MRVEAVARRLDREDLDTADGYAAFLRSSSARLRGDDARAAQLLARAHTAFVRADMSLHASAALYAQGLLEGGELGIGKVRSATARVELDGIRAPARFLAMLAPGWGK